MALVIALTGGIGSGKSSVANILAKLGAAVIDTDEIAHDLTAAGQPGARAIAREFGAGYLDAAGALDRKRMRELVFSDAAAKQKLEALLHPMIRAEVADRIARITAKTSSRPPYIVLVVPLLIETGAYRKLAQRVLVVDSDEQQQVARVVRRSHLTPAAVEAIMANQASRDERLRHADDIVRNDGDLATLRASVEALHQKYLEKASLKG
jgi:dephospho-CoA kinase